uniref:Centrosomal protein CEP104 N-terminal domain-containing protein n=1 Tax=Timema shepardi TaxID=629360 RepID=A0A7R9FVP5_TIMSH|nr:unnamed protein product [Timema shepardi]
MLHIGINKTGTLACHRTHFPAATDQAFCVIEADLLSSAAICLNVGHIDVFYRREVHPYLHGGRVKTHPQCNQPVSNPDLPVLSSQVQHESSALEHEDTEAREEDRHRATELNAHGPTVRGWQSSRNCSYPQELVFQLHHIATVQRIQVLAHQYLIREYLPPIPLILEAHDVFPLQHIATVQKIQGFQWSPSIQSFPFCIPSVPSLDPRGSTPRPKPRSPDRVRPPFLGQPYPRAGGEVFQSGAGQLQHDRQGHRRLRRSWPSLPPNKGRRGEPLRRRRKVTSESNLGSRDPPTSRVRLGGEAGQRAMPADRPS